MGLRSRSRRTRQAAASRGKRGGGGAFFSDEIRIEKRHPKSPGIPMLIIPASYPTPITDESGERDPDGPFFSFLQGTAKIEPRGGKMQLRTDAIEKAWSIPDDEFPEDDPRVFDPDKEDKPVSFWHHLKQSGDNRVGFSIQHAINILDLREHVEVEKTDRDGNVITYKKGDKQGQPIMVRVPYDPKEHSDDLEPLVARKGYAKVGNGHRTQIEDLEMQFEDCCRSCQTGHIEIVQLICPITDEILLDVDDGEFNEEEIAEFLDKGMFSEAAGRKVFPIEITECDNCEEGARATLYDVVVFLKKSGEGTNSAVSMKTKKGDGWVWLKDYVLADEEPLVSGHTVEFNEETDTFHNVYEFHPEIAKLMKPYDFTKVRKIGVSGMDNSYLASFLGVTCPPEYDDGKGGGNSAGGNAGGGRGRRSRRGDGDGRRRSGGRY